VGSYGTFAIDAAGAWTYAASSATNEFVGGTTYTDTSRLRAPTEPSPSVTVNILGTNDARSSRSATANLTRQSGRGHFDQRHADHLRCRIPRHLRGAGGHRGQLRHLRHRRAGAWTYAASSAHNEFVAEPPTPTPFSVASADGTLTSVTVNILGTNDAAILSSGRPT